MFTNRILLLIALAALTVFATTSSATDQTSASHAGGADAFSIDTDPFGSPANFVYEGPCYDAIDDDGDTVVNDGCPTVEDSGEGGAFCANATDDDGDTVPNDGCTIVGVTEWTNPCANAADEDNDGWTNDGCPEVAPVIESLAECSNAADDDGDTVVNDGCPYQAIGSRQPCAMVERNGVTDWDEDPVDYNGDTVVDPDVIVVDLTADNIPAATPLGEGFGAEISYNETALTILRNNPSWMVAANDGSAALNASDPAPDTDGNNSFVLAIADTGIGEAEYGSSPLARLTVAVDPAAAPGGYHFTLTPGFSVHIDYFGQTWLPDALNNAYLIVLPVPGADPCLDADGDTVPNAADNCVNNANPAQTNTDGDALGDACDSDDDNDKVGDADEGPCGGDSLLASKRPERIDGIFAGIDDDADTMVDEALPGGSAGFDCDGDGYTGVDESHVYFPSLTSDQDSCGTNVSPPTVPASPIGWPADLRGGGIPNSDNRVNLLDLTSFLGPVRYFNTDVGDHPGDRRWDLRPGPGIFTFDINLNDLTGLILRTPAMLGGARAMNGPPCPWGP
jgi:hypothetical protein